MKKFCGSAIAGRANEDQSKNWRRVGRLAVVVVAIVWGGLNFATSASAAWHDRDIRSRGVAAQGLVVSVHEFTMGRRYGSDTYYSPRIRTTIDGQTITTQNDEYNDSDPRRFRVGDDVPVLYDAANPTRVVPNYADATSSLYTDFWTGLIFLVLPLIGLAAVLWHDVHRPRHSTATRRGTISIH